MESAAIFTPPSTSLSGILVSARTQYSRRTRIIKKYQHFIDVRGEVYKLHTEATAVTKGLQTGVKSGCSSSLRFLVSLSIKTVQ